MRLTLRTLLAYLDHTLDPADEAKLQEKVQTSTIASSLVNRIRGVLQSRSLSAPAPDAAAPNDDANTVAEYLDSTLAPELTADIERRCLESDSHLAEVAASHRVLAAALSERTAVPTELRKRLYELKPIGLNETVISEGNGAMERASQPVPPLGPEDSGVSHATTRISDEPDLTATLSAASKSIRKSRRAELKGVAAGGGADGNESPEPALAGKRTRQELEAIEPLLSGGRASRVVPWLVSLAMAAAFLFILSKAFQPFLNKRELAKQTLATDEKAAAGDPTQSNKDISLVPAPPTPQRKPEPNKQPEPNNKQPGAGKAEAIQNPQTGNPGSQATSEPVVTAPAVPPKLGSQEKPEPTTQETPASSVATNVPDPGTSNQANIQQYGPPQLFNPASLLDSVTQSEQAEGNAAASVIPSASIGGVQDHGGLLFTQTDDVDVEVGPWRRIKPNSEIVNGQVIFCPANYRSRLVLDGGVELTLVGPVSIRVERRQDLGGRIGLTIDRGRLLVSATKDPASIWMANPVVTGFVDLSTSGSTVAIEVRHRRLPGQSIEHSSWKTDLIADSIAGRVQLRLHDDADPENDAVLKLGVGQQVRQTFGQDAEIRTVSGAPSWIKAPTAENGSSDLEAELARLVNNDQPVEEALLRTLEYRDVKVAGLAARTLASMGVVFQFFGTANDGGPAGLLNLPQHRVNWPEYVRSLQQMFDAGESSANAIAKAAIVLEGEVDANKLIRMLQGFTQEELDSGDGAILVAFLDDPKLAVRVMAIEILQQITGVTLEYKPEEAATQRRPAINRWKNYVREDKIKFRKGV